MSRRIALLLLAVLAAVVLAPSTAFAHADLASSNPQDGATIRIMPETITLTLSENVREPAFVVVTGPDGTRVNSDDVAVSGDTVTATVDQPAPAGTYSVAYRIISADAHSVTGTLDFQVLAGPSPTPTATTPVPEATAATPDLNDPSAAVESPESTGVSDALIVLGFTAIAMAGLAWLIYTGLKSAGTEDDD